MPFFEALSQLDLGILRAARGVPAWSVSVFHVFTVIGAGWGMAALVPFLVRRATRRATLLLLAAIVVTSAVGNAIKSLTGRARPCDVLDWCAPLRIESPGGWSFPSGHAAGSFTFAAFVLIAAPRYSPLALAYAILVASSRVVLGVHYPSDVLAGAVLGSAIGVAFAAAVGRRRTDGSAVTPDARPSELAE